MNAVSPGGVLTELAQRVFDENPASRERYEAKHALGRLAQPSEIAAVVALSAGDDASFLTGSCVDVEGGWGAIARRRSKLQNTEMPPEASVGLIFDVDGMFRLATARGQLRRLSAARANRFRDRRSLLAMPRLVRSLAADLAGAPVFYLSAVPIGMARLVTNRLERDGYPSGTLVPAGRGPAPRWLVGGSWERKLAAVERLTERMPQVRWVLVGDDAGHDPRVYRDFATRHPDHVAAIALLQVFDVDRPKIGLPARPADGCPMVGAPNGEELLPLVRAALGVPPRPGGVAEWFLSEAERGNEATRLRAWTEGNAVRPLVHGRTYFEAVATEVAATGRGDCVQLLGWRGDADQLLTDDGPTVAGALTAAARRGVGVRGLLWHSHTSLVGYQTRPNRELAVAVNGAGGELVLDQRIRPLGSHHQKLVVIRHRDRPEDDVAFVGGIDLDHGSRDGDDHHGDGQSVGASNLYGPNPAYHDLHVELRGPAVREAEEVFRERWQDPAAATTLPWHVVPNRIRGLPRRTLPLAAAAPDPPATGTCAVQLLRTYPRRWPRYPFAPYGERSIARAYSKALGRAESMVYVEDQYLWSFDVARIFAAALQRSPRLHLIAVVPRTPDNENPFYTESAILGHGAALEMVREAGGDRVQVLDVENAEDRPIYVHAKMCVVDDVWAAVGSDNFNVRSWTHDSELTAAVVDAEWDEREPADPAGLGDGARRFARGLRLMLMREHLGLDRDDDLLDPARAADTIRRRAADLDAWHDSGCRGPRPPGRLRNHPGPSRPERRPAHFWITGPVYRAFLDPDGRPLGMRLRRTY